jgi:RNA polymerase sigma-70 factor, ECF subfamily
MTDRLIQVEARTDRESGSGSETIVRGLYGRQAQRMFGFARRLGLSDEDADDAVQETMARFWRELGSGAAIDDPDAWVYRVLYRISIDHHRIRRRIGALLERMSSTDRRTGDGDPAGRTEVDAVWQAVDRLPERQRAVLYLRYRADMAYEQIGRAMGITPGAARGHATTGLATVRRRLRDEVEP